MLRENKLNKLYEGLIQGDELTTKVLNSYGLNSKNLADLIQDGILQRVKRGHYSFLAIDNLYSYGKELIANKEFDKASACFKRCYALNLKHIGTCYQLFLRSIYNKDYEDTFKYFEVIFNTNNPYYKKDSNFYLYLLSIITELPEKYKEYVKKLKSEDICIDMNDKRYKNKPLRNKIRKLAFKNNFSFAFHYANLLKKSNYRVGMQDVIIQALLFQTTSIEQMKKDTIIDFINNREYEQLISFLNETEQKRNLSFYDGYTLWLAKSILNIQKTNEIPKAKKLRVQHMFYAIDCENYELALQMCKKFNLENNIDNSKSAIYLLLEDMCNLIKKISKPDESKDLNSTISEKTTINENKQKNDQPELISDASSDVLFSNLVKELSELDMDSAFKTLKDYMQSINKSDYEFLVLNLIKLNLLEQNIAFTKVFAILSELTKDDFDLDVSNYITDFYSSLSENRLDKARIYFDIVCNINTVKHLDITTEQLLQALNNAEENLIHNSNSIPTAVDNTNYGDEDACFEAEEGMNVTSDDNKQIILKDVEEELVDRMHGLLMAEQGMVLLEPMNETQTKKVCYYAERYPDLDSFVIDSDKKQRIVLRYAPYVKECVDVVELKRMGSLAFFKKDYDGCIENYKQVLKALSRGHIYARIGLAYLKKGDIDSAIDYLTVANHVSKLGNRCFDFTDLIEGITKDDSNINKEKYMNMDFSTYYPVHYIEFQNDIYNKKHAIVNIDQITNFINETGLDVESACEYFGMSKVQIDTVRLIYAKDYYSQGRYEKGDEFLKSVERSKHKTKFTTDLFNDVQKNKKFYINRPQENPRQLSLTMKPKKPTK